MFKIIFLIISIAARTAFVDGVCDCVKENFGFDIIKSGDNCTIFNRKYAEFLYPIDGLDADSERRNIATWIPGWTDEQCHWNLAKDLSSDNIYHIKSLKFDEYLYSLNTGKPTDTRPVLTWKPKSQCESQCYWKLSLVDAKRSKYFLIENTEYNEYLYASASTFDDDKRRVYTRKNIWPDVNNDEAAHWAINCHG